MKLIPLIILTISLAADAEAHESFTFPPQFHGSQSGIFSSEKQFYLPPESHTVLPYYPMKNLNHLPYSYLPSTATKSPTGTLSPFPIALSTTLLPMTSDEDDEDDNDQPYLRRQYNRTQRGPLHRPERQEIRPIPKNYQHSVDRIDTKLPIQFNTHSEPSTQTSGMQSMSPRSIMISDIQRDHHLDQMKSASFLGTPHISQPGVYMSTTETAIPILRLSNEMDLDGSFSYEALGADQTHYVQHSRMENMGADKEEQVVEGSYSYVGDDGKTYTVHYVADSNGFRASGDHLPVPPPVPEIIQRAVQYNLAEELKKPPHLKSWNDEEKENELSESETRNRFSPPRLSHLFTGKTPEAFSHSSSQGAHKQNNLVTAASSQTPIQIVDFTDHVQNKPNSGTIAPQITFVASQGAHIPSVNPIYPSQQQQIISGLFTTERPAMPQLVNYEANMKEDQDSNTALWRWQYGLNTNSNQNADKNLISRSSGQDDIRINFSDMTADQYTKMLQQQLEPNMRQTSEDSHLESSVNEGQYYDSLNSYTNDKDTNMYNSNDYNTVKPIHETTERISPSTHSIDLYKQQNNYNRHIEENTKETHNQVDQTSRPMLLTQDQFIPRSQTVTRSYNYDDIGFESRRTKIENKNDNAYNTHLNVLPLSFEKSIPSKTSKKEYIFETQETSTTNPSSKIKFTDFIVPEDSKSDFKPIFSVSETQPKEIITTTEISMENMLEKNIFLKNLFKNNKNGQESHNKIANENKNLQLKPFTDTKTDKLANSKYIQFDTKPYNEITTLKKKPMDIADVMNYLSRNQFESARVKSKPQQIHRNIEMPQFPAEDHKKMENKIIRNLRTLQQQEELHGPIKNYKVLQRHNNLANVEYDEVGALKIKSPPPTKVVNLPPLGRAGPTMKTYLPPVYV